MFNSQMELYLYVFMENIQKNECKPFVLNENVKKNKFKKTIVI